MYHVLFLKQDFVGIKYCTWQYLFFQCCRTIFPFSDLKYWNVPSVLKCAPSFVYGNLASCMPWMGLGKISSRKNVRFHNFCCSLECGILIVGEPCSESLMCLAGVNVFYLCHIVTEQHLLLPLHLREEMLIYEKLPDKNLPYQSIRLVGIVATIMEMVLICCH